MSSRRFFRIRNTDALVALKKMRAESVDLIATDPPYKVISGGKNEGSKKAGGILKKNDGKIFAHNDASVEKWAGELYRVLKPQAHCYVMTNLLNLFSFRDELLRVGFKLHNLLIWKKNNVTPNRFYMKNGEYTLFLRKGPAFTINNPGSKTVHDFLNAAGNRDHPTVKPIELMRFYIENSSQPGDVVLDPFMGAGSTGVAALNCKRKFIGFEIDPKYWKRANYNIRHSKVETRLF